jgi:hypothetical protein
MSQPPNSDQEANSQKKEDLSSVDHLSNAVDLKALQSASVAFASIQNAAPSLQHFSKMIQNTPALALGEHFQQMHETWQRQFESIHKNHHAAFRIVSESLSDITRRITASQQVFDRIDFSKIHQASIVAGEALKAFRANYSELARDYERLTASFRSLSEYTQIPSFVVPSAAREIFTDSYAFETILSDEEICSPQQHQILSETKNETSICFDLLREINPDLTKPYLGAHDAFRSRSVDRERHILTSLRELWNHLLRFLAPDDKVIAWIPQGKSGDYLYEGRPTRKTRLLFLARGIHSDSLSDFLIQDTKALVEMINLFNRMHGLNSSLTDSQLEALLLRTDSWLLYVLQIWKESK